MSNRSIKNRETNLTSVGVQFLQVDMNFFIDLDSKVQIDKEKRLQNQTSVIFHPKGQDFYKLVICFHRSSLCPDHETKRSWHQKSNKNSKRIKIKYVKQTKVWSTGIGFRLITRSDIASKEQITKGYKRSKWWSESKVQFHLSHGTKLWKTKCTEPLRLLYWGYCNREHIY